jgi:uncharacterized repeat protein (TIGR01451 family)
VHAIDPNVDLGAGECWEHVFDVDVMDIDGGCSTLPRTIKNTKVRFDVVAPVTQTYKSTADLAPLRVNPHVRIEKEADHKVALPGESVVYTITLINDHPSINATGIDIVDTLPGHEGVYFQYQEMVSGPEPDSTGNPGAGGPIRWVGQSVPANGQLVLAFRAQIPTDIARGRTYKNDVLATTSELICIESIGPTAPVKVVNEVVELSKVVNPDEIAPFGTVRYEIRLKNLDSQPVTGVVVTETLPRAIAPPHFTFLQVAEGDPEPSSVQGQVVVWRDLTIPAGKTLKLRFDAQAAILLGTYNNEVTAWCPRSQEITPGDLWDVEAPVDVTPGIVLYKTVRPTHTVAGQRVVYTVTLSNQSDEDLENIRITDTLPAGFHYERMLNDAIPIAVNPLAWELGQLNKGNSQKFVFQVRVGVRLPTGTYSNTIKGSSASALIPGKDETAAVWVAAADIYSVYLPLVIRDYTP